MISYSSIESQKAMEGHRRPSSFVSLASYIINKLQLVNKGMIFEKFFKCRIQKCIKIHLWYTFQKDSFEIS